MVGLGSLSIPIRERIEGDGPSPMLGISPVIVEEIERIDNILGNFQYFTRPLKIERDLVRVNDVILKTVNLAEVGGLGLGIKLELSRQLPMVPADASLMSEAGSNLDNSTIYLYYKNKDMGMQNGKTDVGYRLLPPQ
jgi:hypothetical protein